MQQLVQQRAPEWQQRQAAAIAALQSRNAMRQRQEAALAALNQRRMLRVQDAIREYGELYPKFLQAADNIAEAARIETQLAELIKLIPGEEVLRINAQTNLVMQQQVVAEKLRTAIGQTASQDEKNQLAGRLAQAEQMVKSLQQDLDNTIQANGVAAERQRLQYETDLRVAQDKVAARDRDLLAAQGDVARLQGKIDNLAQQQAQELNDAVRAAKAAEAQSYRDELTRVQNTIVVLQEEKEKQARELQRYKDKVAAQKSLIESINREAATKDRRMEARVTALEDAKRAALAKVTLAEAAKQKAEEELGTQKSAFETLQKRHEETTDELHALDESKKDVQKQLDDLRDRSAREATNLTNQIKAKDAELKELQTLLDDKIRGWQQSQTDVKTLGERVKQLEADRDKQMKAYQAAKTDLETKLSAAEAKVSSLTSQLATAGTQRTELESKITTVERERDKASEARDAAIANLTKLQKTHGETSAALAEAIVVRDKANADFNAANAKLTDMKREKDALQAQYDDLKKSTDAAREKLQQEVEQKSKEISALTALNNKQKLTIDNLEKNEAQYKQQITALDTQLQDKTAALSAAEAAQATLRGERDAKQLEVQQLSEAKTNLETDLVRLGGELAAEKANVAQNLTKISQLEAAVSAKTGELAAQQLKLDAAQSENTRLDLLVQQQSAQIIALQKERDEKVTLLAEAQGKVSQLEQNIVDMKSDHAAALLSADLAMQALKVEHQSQLDTLRLEQAAEIQQLNDAHIAALNAATRERDALISAHNTAMKNLQGELNAAKETIRKQQEEIEALKRQVETLEKRNRELENEKAAIQRMYDAERRANVVLKEQNENLQKEVESLRSDNAAKASQIAQLTTLLATAKDRIRQLEEEKTQADAKIKELEGRVTAAGQENLLLKKTVDELKTEKETTQKAHEEELKGLREAHKEEMERKDDEVKLSKEQYENLAQILTEATQELNKTRQKHPVKDFGQVVAAISQLQESKQRLIESREQTMMDDVERIREMNTNLNRQMQLMQDYAPKDAKWKAIERRRAQTHDLLTAVIQSGKVEMKYYDTLKTDNEQLQQDLEYITTTIASILAKQKQTLETVQAKQMADRVLMKEEQDKFTAFTNKLYKMEYEFLPDNLKKKLGAKRSAKAIKELYESEAKEKGKLAYKGGKFTGKDEWIKIATKMKNLQDLALSEDEYRKQLQEIYTDEVLPFITAELVECQSAMGGKQAFRGEAAPVAAAGNVAGMRKANG